MNQSILILQKLRFLLAGVYVVGCLFMLSLLISAITGHTPPSASSQPTTDAAIGSLSDSPNAVTTGLTQALSVSGSVANAFQSSFIHSSHTVATGIMYGGAAVTNTSQRMALSTYHGMTFAARGVARGVVYLGLGFSRMTISVLTFPARLISPITESPAVGVAIRPADHETVPVIDPSSPELATARIALPASAQTTTATPEAVWPLHGTITTPFGVPEPPYQPIHTGVDISDGSPSGVTPVTAFRRGHVIDVEHTGGLGNHVVIDHGNGVTSVYGHLARISVAIGQDVDTTSTVGYEGSTGVSTGPHLHFEIRVNGKATDPHQFISGQPY